MSRVSAKTSSTTKDKLETIDKQLKNPLVCFSWNTSDPHPKCVIQEMVFWISQTRTLVHAIDNLLSKSLNGRGSQYDLAAEFNICFQFQVHMARCINSSR